MVTPFGQMLTKTFTLMAMMAPSVYRNFVLCRARHLPLFSHTSPTKLEVHTVSEKNLVPSLIHHPRAVKNKTVGPRTLEGPPSTISEFFTHLLLLPACLEIVQRAPAHI